MHSVGRLIQSVEWILGVGDGGGYTLSEGGYTINLS